MAHKLNKILIEGFKSIKRLDIEINQINVLIGPNGAGKSNFIGLFKFLREVVEERLQVYTGVNGGADKILYYGSKVTPQLHIAVDFSPNYYEFTLLPTVNDAFLFENEYCFFDSKKTPPIKGNINNGGAESKLEEIVKDYKYESISKDVYNVLKSWRVYHFHDTSPEAKVKRSGDRNDFGYLREDASNLASFLELMMIFDKKHYDRIVKTIQLVVPFFKDFVFRTNPHQKMSIMLEWQDKNSDMIFNANELSDGSLRFICLATLLLQPQLPAVILLDEPELGLHPSAIVLLGSLIRKAAKRAQIIISTQSVNLVNEFEPQDVIIVERNGDGSSFSRLDSDKLTSWLERYTLGELWEQNVLGGKP